MTRRREDIIPAVRTQLQQCEPFLQTACKLLRQNGFPENADELMTELKRLRVWTQKDGWLDHLAVPDVSVSTTDKDVFS